MRIGNNTVDNATTAFLSSLAQDFIEEMRRAGSRHGETAFLSSLAQDFIEDARAAQAFDMHDGHS